MGYKWIQEQNMDVYWHQLTRAQAIDVMHVHLFTCQPDKPAIYFVLNVQFMWQISGCFRN
jgi:hypothetical protein